ncbi:MAG: GNAT family N-acetyltransferase [Elusimicrobia bacterium]|nr:MAG: GNAT family N-acetyltransferase [Elusimicrobiota bacterium]
MIEVLPYQNSRKEEWDGFVRRSKNGNFLFYRDFMEYHADRFTDASVLLYKKGELLALLPASVRGTKILSHEGLTFGGMLLPPETASPDILEAVAAFVRYFKSRGMTSIGYKAIPFVFNKNFSSEDLYALSRAGFRLAGRSLSSVILLNDPLPLSRDRRSRINKSRKRRFSVEASENVAEFMDVVNTNLRSKGVTAVHSHNELSRLMARFPENIQLYVAKQNGALLAGAVLFLDNDYVHTQYLHANADGRKVDAVDHLVSTLVNRFRSKGKRFFSFGISTENNGARLNDGLIRFKEGFGAGGLVHDYYVLELSP